MTAEDEIGLAPVFEVWRCIGCGRIEAPQPCVGVCEDRKVRLVEAADYEAAVLRLRAANAAADALEALVRRLAQTRPRAGAWERSYRALQEEARRALSLVSRTRAPPEAAAGEADQAEP